MGQPTSRCGPRACAHRKQVQGPSVQEQLTSRWSLPELRAQGKQQAAGEVSSRGGGGRLARTCVLAPQLSCVALKAAQNFPRLSCPSQKKATLSTNSVATRVVKEPGNKSPSSPAAPTFGT